MNKRLMWVAVFLSILLIAHGRQTCAQEDTYDWALQPKEDGSMHIKVTVTFNYVPSQVSFLSTEEIPIKNIKAWGAQTGKPIDIDTEVVEDGTIYTIYVRENQGKGFQPKGGIPSF